MDYKKAGVDIAMGDKCSAIAYAAAKRTFGSRKGMIGAPVNIEGGFTGALDFGNHYMVFNCDGVGSKMLVGQMMNKYDTLGYDLLAMVADDAICVGAETIAITNTIDTSKVDVAVVEPLMKGLEKACKEQKVVVPGGEIGEMPDLVKGNLWNSAAIGIVEKKKFMLGNEARPGDQIIGLYSPGFRSNGFALIRKILEKKFDKNWVKQKFTGGGHGKGKTWGEIVLTPSLIYSNAVLELLGRFGQARKADIKALAHVTGGGMPGNVPRVLGKYGAYLHDTWEPEEYILQLQEFGKVADKEAYEVWNMSCGMVIVSDEFEKIKNSLAKHGIKAKIIGEVVKKAGVEILSKARFSSGKKLCFEA